MTRPTSTYRILSILILGAVATALLSGCAMLPNSGPTAREIRQTEQSPDNAIGFHIVPIDNAVLGHLQAEPEETISFQPSAIDAVDRIGPGDVLQISIFEVGSALFSVPGGSAGAALGMSAASAPASAAGENLPLIGVERDGTVIIPYVGKLMASGHTPAELGQMIRDGLKGKSQDPQVIVTIRLNIFNNVFVMGNVKTPGKIALTLARERLLDAVAEAGGVLGTEQDTVVRLTRAGYSQQIRFDKLRADAPSNILLSPNDRIELTARPRTYSVFGATGKVSEIPFSTPDLSLASAIARAGGPSDGQADPSAVFLFRYEAGGTRPDGTSEERPIAYHLDLMNPSSYFLAQRFPMKTGDIIFIANASANLPTKLVQILNLFFQPFYTAKVVTQN